MSLRVFHWRRSPFFPEYMFGRDTAMLCPNFLTVPIDFISRFKLPRKIRCDRSPHNQLKSFLVIIHLSNPNRLVLRTQHCCVPTGGWGFRGRRSPFFPEYMFGRDTALLCPNLLTVPSDFISRFKLPRKIRCDR